MGLTPLARLAAFTRNGSLVDAVATMQLQFAARLRDPSDGLYWHGYDAALNRSSVRLRAPPPLARSTRRD